MTRNVWVATALCLSAGFANAQTADLNAGHLAALDGNGDGAVSREEFFEFADFAFKRMDSDKSATLTLEEIDDHLVSDAFTDLDGNGDGEVTPDEFARQMDADFKVADRDGDGILN